MLAVDPAAQGRGVGEALVRACVARAREVGAGAIVICARDFTVAAHRLYERLGFVRTPERDWSPLPGRGPARAAAGPRPEPPTSVSSDASRRPGRTPPAAPPSGAARR